MLAHVNNEDVTKADFDRLVRNLELGNGKPVPPERRDEIYRKVLDELVTYTLLKQEAQARKVTVTDAEVDEQLQADAGCRQDGRGVPEGLGRSQDDIGTSEG